jgi:hypothetical protein
LDVAKLQHVSGLHFSLSQKVGVLPMISGLYITLPSLSTRTFWKCAKFQATAVSGQILLNGKAPFRDLPIDKTWYRISKIRFSANWAPTDYQRVTANNSLETVNTSFGNIVDNYGKSILSDKFDMTEYFELDWPTYWQNNATLNGLNFQFTMNYVPDPEILQMYGNVLEIRAFLQIQQFSDQRWIDAIREGKI